MKNFLDQPPLWRQLQATALALAAVQGGQSATLAIDAVDVGLRPGVQALLFAVLRQLGRARALRQALASRAPPPAVDALLCTALALLWREQDAAYDAHTLVNQTVEAARRAPHMRPQAAFVNACLRRFLRERAPMLAASARDPVALWNHPLWWIQRLQQDYPAQWQEILGANNAQPPLSLRVNLRRSSVAAYLDTLQRAGIAARAVGAHGVTLEQARPVLQLPGFAEGLVSVQDPAAQLAAPLLLGDRVQEPLHVLDACAAPGGKTAHLLELGAGSVTALDVDARRCRRIDENLVRLGLQARVLVGDAAQPQAWWDGQAFDAILLDAPCTASGIVRRHPDVRWLRRPTDVDQLALVQAQLLHSLWPLLKPGGRLLYCTCSVFKAEGAGQMQTFLAHNTDAQLQTSPGHLLPQFGANGKPVPDNGTGDHDGFFYALLQKHGP